MKRILAISLAALLCLCSCEKKKVDPAFIAHDGIRLESRGEVVFNYDPLSCQLSFNRAHKSFSAFTDNMSDYYFIEMSEIPDQEGENITADLEWTTYSTTEIRKGIALKAVKLEGGLIWLWNGTLQIGLTVRMID